MVGKQPHVEKSIFTKVLRNYWASLLGALFSCDLRMAKEDFEMILRPAPVGKESQESA